MRLLACVWCGRPTPKTHPNRLYCDHRCSMAMRNWRRRRVGIPGVRPAEKTVRIGGW